MNALTVKPESMKEKKVAQPVEEQKPSPESNAFDIEAIKAKIPKAFQGYVEPVIAWAQSVEARMAVMQKEMPKQVIEELRVMAAETEKRQQEEYINQIKTGQRQLPIQGQGGLMQYLPVLAQMMGGGGDNELQKLAMQSLVSNINMSSAITNAVVAKITGKATSEVAESVTK